jgi:hypothetical protein
MIGNDVAVLLGFLTAAIALAGFAGIVTSIDRGAAVASNEVISFRARNLVKDAGLSHSLFAANLALGALAFGVLVAGASGAVAARGAYFTGLFYLLYLMCRPRRFAVDGDPASATSCTS